MSLGTGGGRSNMSDLLELAGHLRDEKLFITQEKKTLHNLFTSLDESTREVHGLNWILQQQRCVPADLILGSPEITPEVCFTKFNDLEDATFLDGYKLLTHHEIKVGKFLKGFRESPEMVALCLLRAEGFGLSYLQRMVRTVMLQLYGGLLLPRDEVLVVSMLKHLLRLQVTSGKVKNPVRFVSKRNNSFVHAYRFLTECLPSSKPFLTVAFHDPTVALLAEDEWHYDLEPEKALGRFDPAELRKKFGTPETESFKQKVEVYMSRVVGKLISLVERFLYGLEFGAPVFPRSLSIVLKEAFDLFVRTKGESKSTNSSENSQRKSSDSSNMSDIDCTSCDKRGKDCRNAEGHDDVDAKKACLYLLLNVFVCPAICDPEKRGVVFDVSVGDIARHNLVQVAQLIQVLALSPFKEEVDSKYRSIFDKFDKDSLSYLLESITCSKTSLDDNLATGCHGDDQSHALDHPERSSVLISPQEFVDLMELIHTTSSSPPSDDTNKDYQNLKDLVASSNLPPMNIITGCCQKYLNQSQEAFSPLTNNISNKSLAMSYSSAFGNKKNHASPDEGVLSRSTSAIRTPATQRSITSNGGSIGGTNGGTSNPPVLVINLGVYSECPGMLSEQKVFEQELKSRKNKLHVNSILPGVDDNQPVGNNLLISGKRTRFSLSHDTDSIEPNNEGVSEEAVSSHSTDDDDDNNNSTDNNSNDNLSDMAYSANLSGRNTPSILSGRDTPVSLMSGGVGGAGSSAANSTGRCEEERFVIAEVVINNITNPVAGRTNSRESGGSTGGDVSGVFQEVSRGGGSGVVSMVVGSGRDRLRKRDVVRRDDVTDKFGKFDININIELEAKSTVSDTWSTDVLASDSEPPPEQNHLVRLEEVIEENVVLASRVSGGGGMGPALSETGISETASDAWSTDVLASDTSERQAERLLELDQDETYSLSGRCTLSLAGLNVTANESGFEKAHSTGNVRHHPPRSTMTPQQHHLPDLHPFSEVFDNFSDTSSHKEASSSFDIFDPPDADSNDAFTPKNSNNNFVKRDFEILSNPTSGCLAEVGGPIDDKPFDNNINSVNNSNQFMNPKFLQDLSDDSEVVSKQNLSALITGANYDAGFEMFDPFAPVVNGSQGRQLAKAINSSSADNLDTLANPICNNLYASSRASSSMTHIFDDHALPSSSSPDQPITFPKSRSKENKSNRSEMKKKSGLFGTFRERLSKVNQANKRKISRQSEESHLDHHPNNPHVLIDFEGDIDVTSDPTTNNNNNSYNNININNNNNNWKQGVGSINMEIILAKYRKSPTCDTPTPSPIDPLHNTQQHLDYPPTPSYSAPPLFHRPSSGELWGPVCTPGEPSKPSGSFRGQGGADVFGDAKKKLKIVLSLVDCSQFMLNKGRSLSILFERSSSSSSTSKNEPSENDLNSRGGQSSTGKVQLIMLLKVLLADSIVCDDKILATQLQETIRCLTCLDAHEIKRLLKSLKDDYKMRSHYIAYLTRCKKSILTCIAFYEGLLARVRRERSVVNKYLVSVMTRLCLERREIQIIRFISEFQRLQLFDEKSDLLEKFLYNHYKDMRNDPSWKAATDSQLNEAQLCIERTIMSHIYIQALFPNGDGDILRDRKMEDHMRHLARIITPDNKYLKIPPIYHNECPWLAAQKELSMINAFKTPEDKLECVMRCCSTIMTLLSLALTEGTATNDLSDGACKGSGDGEENTSPSKSRGRGGVPAADDFMPLLIYVVIMSCTPNLLSTVQYVKSYCEKTDDGRGDSLEHGRQRNVFNNGEKYYWWMQFVAAVEFIKTMEYGE